MGQEFEKMKEKAPDNFRLDFAVSREQTNEKGEKMYIQTRMAQYAEELWELLKKDNTFVYMCGRVSRMDFEAHEGDPTEGIMHVT